MEIIARILKGDELAKWDELVAGSPVGGVGGDIHQCSDWGRFQQTARGEDWRWWVVGMFEIRKGAAGGDERLIGGGLVLRRMMGMGKSWLYCPKGPLLDYHGPLMEMAVQAWLEAVERLARREKVVYLRVEPGLVVEGPAGFGVKVGVDWERWGMQPAHAHYQPENTLVVDLRESEEGILAQMKAKGRYNVRLAEKKGVEALRAGDSINLEDGVKAFHGLLQETTARDGFGGHTANYYLQMLHCLGHEKAELYLARYQGEIIAGVLVTFFGGRAIYYFGASGDKHRNVMAPYLLQWRAMQEAKARGCEWYDFLGTAPLRVEDGDGTAGGEFSYDSGHPWAGVTAFKLKFGGHAVNFGPGAEMIYERGWYRAIKWLKKWRR